MPPAAAAAAAPQAVVEAAMEAVVAAGQGCRMAPQAPEAAVTDLESLALAMVVRAARAATAVKECCRFRKPCTCSASSLLLRSCRTTDSRLRTKCRSRSCSSTRSAASAVANRGRLGPRPSLCARIVAQETQKHTSSWAVRPPPRDGANPGQAPSASDGWGFVTEKLTVF